MIQHFKSTRPVRAVTLDLDDTLWDNRPIIRAADTAVFQKLKTDFPDVTAELPFDALQAGFLKMRNRILVNNPTAVNDVTDLRLQVYTAALTPYGVPTCVARDLVDLFLHHRSQFKVPQESLELLAMLFDKWPLVAITNGNVSTEPLGIHDFFKTVVKPTDCDARKPAKAIFDYAAEQLRLPNKDILHIGDHPIYDVHGANLSGMQSIWFAPFLPELENHTLVTLPQLACNQFDKLSSFLLHL